MGDAMTFDTKASREIMAKRTPGEWLFKPYGLRHYGVTFVAPNGLECPVFYNEHLEHVAPFEKDAKAIVHAVIAHDEMCDEIDAQAARIAELEEEVERLRESERVMANRRFHAETLVRNRLRGDACGEGFAHTRDWVSGGGMAFCDRAECIPEAEGIAF